MGLNNSMLRCVNDAGDRESDLISMRNLRVRNKDKRELQFGNRVVYLSPFIESGDESSSHFSHHQGQSPPLKNENKFIPLIPQQLSKNTEMSMQRLKKLSTMIKLGNIEGLDYLVTKWQWQYDDIKFENLITPLILAVMSNQLPMVQFLVSQGVDMDHLDLVGRSAIDWSISCNYETIYYFLKSSVKKTTSSTASSTSSQSVQSVQILEIEPNIHSRSLKSANKQPRVVAFYEDSPDMRSTQRAARNYQDELASDEPNFKKDVMPPFSGRHIESLKVSDHLSPLTQSTAVPFTSSKKSSSILSPLTSRSSRSKQSRSWSAIDSIASERTVEPTKSETLRIEVDNANTKDLSPDSVRKWMTKRIVAAAEAVIPNIESANPPVTKPRFTRSIRKASSKAVKYFWKKKFDTKKIEE